MNRNFFAVIVVVVGILVGTFWLTSKKTSAPGTDSATSNHIQGAGTSGVTLIEYGDFQCPACGQYFPLLKQLKNHYGDRIIFRFRHFPLVQIHPNAMAAHRAAEAAGNQGQFWEMHDLLYGRQQLWTDVQSPSGIFEAYAEELGLDMEHFRLDVSSEATFDVINADIKEGQKAGASSTPTFVLDGKKLENPRSLEDFIKLIDDLILSKTTGSNQ